MKKFHAVATPNCSAEAFQRGCSQVKSEEDMKRRIKPEFLRDFKPCRKFADFERSCKIDTAPKAVKLLRTAIVDTPDVRCQMSKRSISDG